MKSFIRSLLAAIGLTAMAGASAQAQVAELPAFDAALADTANWREAAPENLIEFQIATARGETRGRVLIEAAPFAAPGHVERFTSLAASGDLDGTMFHRVIEGFMAQGGDIEAIDRERAENWPNMPGEFIFTRVPNSEGDSVPAMQKLGLPQAATSGYILGFPVSTQAEAFASLSRDGSVQSWIPHCKGVVSTARTSDPNSASTQFFLMRDISPWLNREYTAWGRIVSGQDVVDSIEVGEPVRMPDVLVSARLVSEMPEEERPRVLVQRTDGPLFASFLEANAGASVCDLPPVPTIVSN
ncbi:peptidylprolyl isomerase [Ponticaulis koreensis]|uniref:peptidylprolyl isomerase n=1 Tax=Ponticaulis koreensis TaxID=1123045 RepID=UPI0003B5B28C|nr:peptidylprolyl isomerase [Ponticaulis koreensis]